MSTASGGTPKSLMRAAALASKRLHCCTSAGDAVTRHCTVSNSVQSHCKCSASALSVASAARSSAHAVLPVTSVVVNASPAPSLSERRHICSTRHSLLSIQAGKATKAS